MNNRKSSALVILAQAAAAVLVIGALTAAIYVGFVEVAPEMIKKGGGETVEVVAKGYGLARRVAKDVVDTLNFRPRVTVGSETIYQKDTPILELATVSRRFSHTYFFEHKWAGSAKRFEIKGDFVAKAGYNLQRPFSIDVSPDGTRIRMTMPPVQILSVEEISESVLHDENGFWNRVTPQEREDAKNKLLAQARKIISQSDLLTQAEANFMQQLTAIVRKNIDEPVKLERVLLP